MTDSELSNSVIKKSIFSIFQYSQHCFLTDSVSVSILISLLWLLSLIDFLFLFFLIGIHSLQGWTVTKRHRVTTKRSTKRLKQTKICLKKPTVKMYLLILDLKSLRSQVTEKHWQRIPEFSCTRKETVDIDILVTPRNGDREMMQSFRMTSRPLRIRKWNQFNQFRWTSTKVIPIEKTWLFSKFKTNCA